MTVLSPVRGLVAGPGGSVRPRRAWWIPVICGALALALALGAGAYHPHALPQTVLIGAGSVLLCAVCGDALAVLLVPPAWRTVRPLLTVAFGAAASGIVLMAFGVAFVPLHVSLWLTLALGLGASWWVRRRERAAAGVEAGSDAGVAARGRSGPRGPSAGVAAVGPGGADRLAGAWAAAQRGDLAIWAAVLGILFLVLMIPAWRTGALTIYGQNPDSSQVVGIAVLFQHIPPTHTDNALPPNVVPQAWRFRYPIFYPLAAVANLLHADPIRVFPVLSALLVLITAVGFALVAVRCFRAPAWSGPAIAALIGFTWILQYLAWHPYWNQLWGTAMLPYALLFGWQAIESRDGTSAIACVVMLLMLWFAYPLAIPYPLVILAAVLAVNWQRPRLPRVSGARGWLAAVAVLALLTPAVIGSVLKLKEAIVQLLTPNSALWGGDVTHFISYSTFAGTGGGPLSAILVLIAAAYGCWRLGPRLRVSVGVVIAALLLLDLRFRLTASGPYMDFKHLSFMGLIVLSLAAAGIFSRLSRPGWIRWVAAVGLLLWVSGAVSFDRTDAVSQNEQVTPQLFQIRQWAHALPRGASVRVDIPPGDGGMQLWAVQMLAGHPVDSYEPVLNTTYAHAAPGFRADYSLALAINPATGVPIPAPRFTVNPPLFANQLFVLRRIDWPARDDGVAQTASTRLVQP
ncbi:hypothetical protein [Conexibacter sp. DBS9H8]|uniref:hypothetical protein n=1 Tax=Conexibacter sp. DBS9H8 TaxID=2937801 RepID=UPI00200DF082|nr:hypothetical protein [Conexibacter sp. DBS9H8]